VHVKRPYKLFIVSVAASLVGIGLLFGADSTYDGENWARSAGVFEVIALILLGISAVWISVTESVRGTYLFAGWIALAGAAYVAIAFLFGVNVHGYTALWMVIFVVLYFPLAIIVGLVAAIRSLSK